MIKATLLMFLLFLFTLFADQALIMVKGSPTTRAEFAVLEIIGNQYIVTPGEWSSEGIEYIKL